MFDIPHPNECTGGDLVQYIVCWDPDLIPSEQVELMDYFSGPTMEVDHDVTIKVYIL